MMLNPPKISVILRARRTGLWLKMCENLFNQNKISFEIVFV